MLSFATTSAVPNSSTSLRGDRATSKNSFEQSTDSSRNYLMKTADGGASISMFDDQAGTEESTRRATAYIRENLESVGAGPPEVIEGETVIQFAR